MELMTELLRSLVKTLSAVTITGREAVKLIARPLPVGRLIGASVRNEEYCPLAATVMVTGSVEVPASSVRKMLTLTSWALGLAIAMNDRILSEVSAKNVPLVLG